MDRRREQLRITGDDQHRNSKRVLRESLSGFRSKCGGARREQRRQRRKHDQQLLRVLASNPND